MSLINDVLRDLERRRQSDSSDGLRGVRPVLAPERRSRGVWLVAVLVPLMAVGGWWGYSARAGKPPAAAAPQLEQPAEPAPIPRFAQLTGLALSHGERRLRIVMSLDAEVAHRVERGDSRLRLVIDKTRLGAPVPAPTGEEGLLEAMDVRQEDDGLVLDLAFSQKVRVQTALEPRGSGAALIVDAHGIEAARATVVVEVEPPRAIAAVESTAAVVPRRAPEAPVNAAPADAEIEAVAAPSRREAGVFQKTPKLLSPAELAARSYAEGMRHWRDNRAVEADEAWRQALEHDPAHADARAALADLLARQGRGAEAGALLRQAHERWPQDQLQAERYARYLIANGRDGDAVTVLEAARPAAVGDGEYLALLGAVYQRLGRHAESAEAYGRVLSVHPGREIWWMGMAIALEGAGNVAPALQAYRRALALPSLSPELRRYAETRAKALE